jgi:phosphonate transport system permease protein
VKLQQRLIRILVFPVSVLYAPFQLVAAALSRQLHGVVLLHDRASRSSVRTYVHPTGVPRRRVWQTQWGWVSLALLGITLFLGWILIEADLGALFSRTEEARRVFLNIVRPDFTHFTKPDPTFYQRAYPQMFSIVNLMVVTVLMALAATLLGAVFALPLSFLGARNLMCQSRIGWGIFVFTRGFFNIFRSIEALIWVVVFAVWIGYGNPFTGVMALVVHTIAALGKLYSEQVESIDPGPIEAILASGGSRLQVIRYAIIPQVMPSFLAFTLYRWDINVRMATIIALVGGGGIGDMLFYYRHLGDWSQVGAVVVAMVVVVWTLDYISGRVRERIA